MPREREKTRKKLLSEPAARDLGLDFEISLYERSLASDPSDTEVLDALGLAYTARGLYDKGLEVDRRLTRIEPDNHTFVYNLACSLSLLGRIGESVLALEHAIELGFRDLELLTRDPDLKAVRTDPRFLGLIEKASRHAAS
jgi:Flp pilus assembly protein TadD